MSALLFTGCDTILRGDNDVGPELNLIQQYQDDEWLFFTFEMHNIKNIGSFACEIVFDPENFDILGNQELYEDLNSNGIFDESDQSDDCGLDGLCNASEPGYNPDPNGDNYDPEGNPEGLEGNSVCDSYCSNEEFLTEETCLNAGWEWFGEEFSDCGIDNLCDEDEPGYTLGECSDGVSLTEDECNLNDEIWTMNLDPNDDNYDPEGNPEGLEGNSVCDSYCINEEFLTEETCLNAGWEWFGEEFSDCGIDNLYNEYEPGWNIDPNGDDYHQDDNPTGTEANGIWDDLTVLLYEGFRQYNAILEASGYEPNFNFFYISEGGKISISGGLVDMGDGGQLEFPELDSPICLIALNIKSENPSEIMIDEWKLKDENGNDLYFGGQVSTDTLLVNFTE